MRRRRAQESERAAFLAETCAGDEALRREVESLLAQPASAEAFLAQPAGAMARSCLAPSRRIPSGSRDSSARHGFSPRSIIRTSAPSTASSRRTAFRALVLELVEGQMLADAIAGGPITKATSRPSTVSRARKTSPIPPAPSSSWIW
jgi:hypothetical protein